MENKYLRSVWKLFDEPYVHECLEEAFSKRGLSVINYHRDDRVHEQGIDVLCTKSENVSLAFAVKCKPGKGDIKQLETLAANPPNIKKFYVYLDSPTRPFRDAMKKHTNVYYIDSTQLHRLLIHHSSIKYILAYYATHPLFQNLKIIYTLLYEKRGTHFTQHRMTIQEESFLWSIKDDAVKLKAIFDYLKHKLRPTLMGATQFCTQEYHAHLQDIHHDFDLANSIAGTPLATSFSRMSSDYPNLAAQYWDIVSARTRWKEFTATAEKEGSQSKERMEEYTLRSWIIPHAEPNTMSSRYYPMRSFYSTLYYLIDSTYELADDIEKGIDWLFEDMLRS